MRRRDEAPLANRFTAVSIENKTSVTEYFDWFNGKNLDAFISTWDNSDDLFLQIKFNVAQVFVIRRFTYKIDGNAQEVIATMNFIVEKDVDEKLKILSLTSAPMFASPPDAMNEVPIPPAKN